MNHKNKNPSLKQKKMSKVTTELYELRTLHDEIMNDG